MLIDSHAHIYDEEYNDEGGAQPIIAAMDKDNLEYIVCVGCDVPTWPMWSQGLPTSPT